MCGRYGLRNVAEAEHYFAVHGTPWKPMLNIAPSDPAPIVRVEDGKRVGLNVRWGLVPWFAGGIAGKYPTFNARIETVETNASYREPWKRGRRCLQVANGFYEWHLETSGANAGRKTPFWIHLTDREVFGFAALWDRSRSDEGTVIESCTHITMPANSLLYDIHNQGANPHRMPAIVRKEDEEVWLRGSIEEVRQILKPYPAELMMAYRVRPLVNNSKNKGGEELIEPAGKGSG